MTSTLMESTLNDDNNALVPAAGAVVDHKRVTRAFTRLDHIARLMDDQFEVPLTGKRIGLDPIIGLIPGGGDWAVWFVSVYIFFEAARLGAPPMLLARMAANIGVDLLGGYVPVAGDLFDAVFKANLRNVLMLREYYGSTPELGAAFPDPLPEHIRLRPPTSALVRYSVWGALSLVLLVVASGPILFLMLIFGALG